MDTSHSMYKLTRENGAFIVFDAQENMLLFSDRDLFQVFSYAVSGGDLIVTDGLFHQSDGSVLTIGDDNRAAVNLFKRVNGSTFAHSGDMTEIHLDDYDIELRVIDDMVYVPLATVSDLILPITAAFNGEAVFLMSGAPDDTIVNDDGKTLSDLYYAPSERTRSEELAEFNYAELCLLLDEGYGLQAEHNVTNGFDDYFIASSLAPQLCSTDMSVYTNAVKQLMDGYFGDQHSGLLRVSPWSGGHVEIAGGNTSVSLTEADSVKTRFSAAREAAGITKDGQITDGYSEVGDTAFITFDRFTGSTMNYYNSELWSHFVDYYMNDTISLVVYAQSMIHRENSPIRKVVIDLSVNIGGSLEACAFIAAWVLGAANISLEDTITGGRFTTTYWVDTNLDGIIGYDDELGVDDLDVYCLISGVSFSCANFLAALFKEDGRVTLVGQTSGGGSCFVRNAATADGTLICFSDRFRMSIVSNGSFYSVDRGIEPDVYLRKCASFYDRAALADYLDTIR